MGGAQSRSHSQCIFCQIACKKVHSNILHADEKVIAFPDISPSALRHYLVIPVEHISTVNDLKTTAEVHQLVGHMLNVGQTLLQRDAPESQFRFGFHQPPFNSIDHLHLHCLAMPFSASWRELKYTPMGPLGGFIEADKLLEKLKPLSSIRF